MIRYVAFATKGLEDVAADEVARLIGDRPEAATKRVVFATPDGYDPTALRGLTTVDDVCLLVADSSKVLTSEDLRDLLSGVEMAIGAVERLRPLDSTFSITVTAARASIGSSAEIAAVVADTMRARLGWRLREASRAPVDVRVFADGSTVLVGVRLFDRPLSDRAYRVAHRAGALRPTVAAAMVRLARPGADPYRVWDPFCGSGTILAEALLAGHTVFGSDVDTDAIAVTRENLATAWAKADHRGIPDDAEIHLEVADASGEGAWRRHVNVDTVVANLPWGKQIPIQAATQLYAQVGLGVARLAAAGGRACLLTTQPDRLAAAIRRVAPNLPVTRRQLGLLGQLPTLLLL